MNGQAESEGSFALSTSSDRGAAPAILVSEEGETETVPSMASSSNNSSPIKTITKTRRRPASASPTARDMAERMEVESTPLSQRLEFHKHETQGSLLVNNQQQQINVLNQQSLTDAQLEEIISARVRAALESAAAENTALARRPMRRWEEPKQNDNAFQRRQKQKSKRQWHRRKS